MKSTFLLYRFISFLSEQFTIEIGKISMIIEKIVGNLLQKRELNAFYACNPVQRNGLPNNFLEFQGCNRL